MRTNLMFKVIKMIFILLFDLLKFLTVRVLSISRKTIGFNDIFQFKLKHK